MFINKKPEISGSAATSIAPIPSEERCDKCHRIAQGKALILCIECEAYAAQDRSPLKEVLIDSEILGARNEHLWDAPPRRRHCEKVRRDFLGPLFARLKLTRIEQDVFRLFFEKGLGTRRISKILGISRDCARWQVSKIQNKLRRSRSKLQWLRTLPRRPRIHRDRRLMSWKTLASRPSRRSPDETMLRSPTGMRCPRCQAKAFGRGARFHYCADCLHTWP